MPGRRLQKGNCLTALQPWFAYNAAMSFTLNARHEDTESLSRHASERRRRARRPRADVVAVALASVALLAAACGGASPSQATTTIPPAAQGRSTAAFYTDKLHYAQCMRANGVPNYPDPQSNGQFLIQPGEDLPSRNSPQFISANKACQHLLPDGGDSSGTAAVPCRGLEVLPLHADPRGAGLPRSERTWSQRRAVHLRRGQRHG